MSSLWQQGLELMLYGMGTVFVFLALLVLTTSLMSALVQRFLPDPVALTPAARRTNVGGQATAHNEQQLMAVITAAIHRHRQQNKSD